MLFIFKEMLCTNLKNKSIVFIFDALERFCVCKKYFVKDHKDIQINVCE